MLIIQVKYLVAPPGGTTLFKNKKRCKRELCMLCKISIQTYTR